jgi:hypothetical protein
VSASPTAWSWRLDAVEAEEVAGFLCVIHDVVETRGQGQHVAALERHREAGVEVVDDVVRDRVVVVLDVDEL